MGGFLDKTGLITPQITTEEIILRGKPISDSLANETNIRITSPHALGDFYFSITPYVPEGVLSLNGSEVSRTTYSDLYDYVLTIHNELVESGKKFIVSEEEWQNISIENNGYVPYYSYGVTDGMFRLPKMSGYLKATGEVDEAGNYVAEGLPNITGNLTGMFNYSANFTSDGVFEQSVSGSNTKDATGGGGYWSEQGKLIFSANDSNPIYGNSEHVTPETNTLFVGVWALVAFTQVGTANLNEIKEILSQCETILGDSLPLLSSRYDNKGLETSSWKLSDGSWLDGRIYTDAYNKISQRLAEGDSTCLEMKESELLSSSEFPENFLIDTEGVKLRLPLFVVNERTIIKEYTDNYNFYKIYSDGWCEQGGRYDKGAVATSFNVTISLPIIMKNINYFPYLTTSGIAGDKLGTHGLNIENITTNSFDAYYHTGSTTDGAQYIYWRIEGYAAEIPPREEWEIDFNYYFKVSHGVDEGRINIEEKLTEFEEIAYSRLDEVVEEVSKDYIVHVDKQVGELYFSFDNYCPDGVIPLDGRLVNRATYADLWEWVQEKGLVKDDALITTNDENTVSIFNEDGSIRYCQWYGSGDGELTFRMPRINGYLGATGDNTLAGQYTAEGLPNITGSFEFSNSAHIGVSNAQEAFIGTGTISMGWTSAAGGAYNPKVLLDASSSNSIYGNSEHVTPETNTLFVGVWAITATKAALFDMRDVEEALKSAESYLMNNVPLMSSRWDRDGLGNLGWVKADGSWIDGRHYTGAYAYCVEKLVSGNEDFIDGQVSVISEENFDKFIVDRINKRFRLPITNGQRTWEEVQGLNNPTWVLYWKLAHEFYLPAQAEIQEKLDLIDNLVVKTDINLPTLSSRWDSDFAENIGWVKSEGHWLNDNVYRDAYDLMISRIGINDKFIEATEGTELTDENADKFLIDTTAAKFRLPLINGERTLVSTYKEGTQWYNLYSDGYIEQGGEFHNSGSDRDVVISFLKPFIDTNYIIDKTIGITGRYTSSATPQCYSTWNYTNSSFTARAYQDEGLHTFRWMANGYSSIVPLSDYNCNNYLYFKLADEVPSTVVNTEQVVADLKQECDDFKATLEEKFNSGAFVTETFRSDDGKSWYRIYSDGWIEQGGTLEETGHTAVITFLVPFTDINWSYYAGGEYYTTSTGTPVIAIVVNTKSITGASFQCRWNGTAAAINSTIPKCTWYACGY